MMADCAVPEFRLDDIDNSEIRYNPGSPDDALVESARKGDAGAFSQLIERHNQLCIRRAYMILRNRDDAEDSVQTSWIQAWTHLNSFRSQGTFSAWIGRIVTNQCLTRLRKSSLVPLISLNEVFGSVSSSRETSFRLETIDPRELPEETLGDEEVAVELKKQIRHMPPLLRNVLVLRDLHEMELHDVAERLGVSIPAAKSRLTRARAELRERLKKRLGTTNGGNLLRRPIRKRVVYVRAA